MLRCDYRLFILVVGLTIITSKSSQGVDTLCRNTFAGLITSHIDCTLGNKNNEQQTRVECLTLIS